MGLKTRGRMGMIDLSKCSAASPLVQTLPRPGYPAGANDYDNASTRILSAYSQDGNVWVPEPGVRLSPQEGGAGNFRVVSSEMCLIRLPGAATEPPCYRMFYEACDGTAPNSRGGSRIASAISDANLPS